LLAAIGYGIYVFVNSSFFDARNIEVSGQSFVSKEELIASAQIPRSDSTLFMRTSDIEERLTKNPWVASASVEKGIPNDIRISVVERTPAVSVLIDGVTWIASSDARWLGTLSEDGKQVLDPSGEQEAVNLGEVRIIPVEGLPEMKAERGAQIKDEALSNALANLRGLDPQIVVRTERVVSPEPSRTSLYTFDGVELDVGESRDLAEKSQIILEILEEQAGNVVLINVRSIEKPTWRGLTR
jgi:hypothetical protein